MMPRSKGHKFGAPHSDDDTIADDIHHSTTGRTEAHGGKHVRGGNEADNLVGSDGDDHMSGGRGFDHLRGGKGHDHLAGGHGKDILTGGAGDDTFVFDTALVSGNVDHITDFNPGHDTIALDHAIFTGLTGGFLERSAFKDIASHKEDANDRILYNHKTGELFFDADGAGGQDAIHFATLNHHPSIKYHDFLVT